MSHVTVYSLPVCPNCNELKKALTDMGVDYDEKDLGTTESRTTMLINSVFTSIAPVMRMNGKFYTYDALFKDNKVNMELILEELGVKRE